MKRRDFVKSAALAGALIPAASCSSLMKINVRKEEEIKQIKPKRLKEGDTIGLITPGGYISERQLNNSIESVEKLGFKTFHYNSILSRSGYLGGTDEERTKELKDMFANDKVDGIICARGGYGCNRILPHIDYEIIRQNPKALIGYSDITALLYSIYAKTGLVGYHGPVGISSFNEYSVDAFNDVLMNPKDKVGFKIAEEDIDSEDKAFRPYKINGGKATGELIGGNLSIVVTLIGSEYDVDYSNKILFLEDIGEEPYRIDRMLTELIISGKLQQLNGIILGVFENCETRSRNPEFAKSFTLKEVLTDRLAGLKIPVFYGFSFGHVKNKVTIPFGIQAEIDADNFTLTLLEKPVV